MKTEHLRFLHFKEKRNWRVVACVECGEEFNTHLAAVVRAQRGGYKLHCSKCFRKGEDEIKQASINLYRNKQKCNAAARKLSEKTKLKGARQ